MAEKKLSETFNRIMAFKPTADNSLLNAPPDELQASLETVLDEYDAKTQPKGLRDFYPNPATQEDPKTKRAGMKNLRAKQTHTRIIAQHISFKVQ